jgi:hypothetical protein
MRPPEPQTLQELKRDIVAAAALFAVIMVAAWLLQMVL